MATTTSSMLFNITPDGNVFLRMDGTNITKFENSGGGTVNCQLGNYTWEAFAIINNGDGTFSFESNYFPNRYLRNAGTDVNCQYWDSPADELANGPNEKYIVSPGSTPGTYNIESNISQGYYLKIDGSSSSFENSGFGTVSLSSTAQDLYILPLFGAPNAQTPS